MREWIGYAMKVNEIVLTVVQLSAPVFCFSVGLFEQGVFLVCWIVFFGIAEFVSKAKTGKTLSQHVWSKPMWVRVTLSLIMIAGMVVLGVHFIWG